MRILYVVGQLARGGAEQQLYHLLANIDVQAAVVSLSTGGYWAEPIRRLGHQVIELERRGHREVRRLRQVVHLIQTFQPGLIHIFLGGVSGLYGRLAALLAGHTRIIVGERGHPASDPTWYRLILPWLNRRTVAVVCNSPATRDYLLQHRLAAPDKIHVIPNGIEVDKFQNGFLSGGWPWPASWHGKPVIGTVGHLTYAKSPETFIQVAARIHRCWPDVRFAVVGDGPLRPQVQHLAASLGVAEITWLMGKRQDVPNLLRAMDVFVLTSRSEGMPNAVLEAMASRVPCVVTDAGGCRELVIDGQTGYVVPVGDIDALASRVLYLLNDQKLRADMGWRGYERVKQEFDVSTMATKYTELYASILRS